MDYSLPYRLEERTRWENQPQSAVRHGKYVLYWTHNALRAHDNPALDTAIHLSRQNDVPLLVYQGLCEKYPFASDRHHAFILQGARDLQRQMDARGIRYVFHLQHRGDRGPYLRNMVRDAALLVTEEMPVEPLVGWLERLTTATTTPILTVDASCIVPMTLVTRPHTRAFQYRQATADEYAQRIGSSWVDVEADCPMYDGPLPLIPLNLQDLDLANVIGKCDIDHTVAPVADTPGGTRAAYRRWNYFKEHLLNYYAENRNDAALQASSRMSAYLHYGMASPFRLAREAQAAGADKFLDELLIWREMAHVFCFHHRHELDTFELLPAWARESLECHASDPRPVNLSWESLARGRGPHPLWNACQRSLVKHGELHNNTRMTWGKALLPMVQSPHRALSMLLDLNHRFALDGRGPCSYGGLLWCLGQFDRPFAPDQSIYGSVRTRPLEEHEQRLDLQRFEQCVDRPITSLPAKVAIVGAGLAGLVAARTLVDYGLDVTVFDKSRGVGGRLATRRAPSGVLLDHGAQYFTVRDARFARHVRSWLETGLVQPWEGRIVELKQGCVGAEKNEPTRYVGVPAMNSIARHLATGLEIVRETRVAQLRHVDSEWQLHGDAGDELGVFDYVIVNCPPHQVAAMLPADERLRERLQTIEMEPCWAVLMELEEDLELNFDAAFVQDSPLSWIARDSSKPGRPAGVTWVLHASPVWTLEHLDDDPDDVLAELLDAFSDATGATICEPITLAVHRWRYARPRNPLDEPCIWEPTIHFGACGDWCGGPRVEGAFLSGQAMAGALLRHLTVDRAVSEPTALARS